MDLLELFLPDYNADECHVPIVEQKRIPNRTKAADIPASYPPFIYNVFLSNDRMPKTVISDTISRTLILGQSRVPRDRWNQTPGDKNRKYSRIMQFQQPDPKTPDPQHLMSLNRFMYVFDNPIKNFDSTSYYGEYVLIMENMSMEH
jgi:hypothetical protein